MPLREGREVRPVPGGQLAADLLEWSAELDVRRVHFADLQLEKYGEVVHTFNSRDDDEGE